MVRPLPAWGIFSLIAANGGVTGSGDQHLDIEGNVTTGSGSILLESIGHVRLYQVGGSGSTASVIGGSGFSGTIAIHADLLGGSNAGYVEWYTPGCVISTTNASPTAVDIDSLNGSSTPESINLGNVTTGNGGTITIGVAGSYDTIVQEPSSTFNAGATGTVKLIAAATGTAADEIGTSSQSINVTAANVTASATDGNVYVTDSQAGTFTATAATGGKITLATTTGALTIGGATNTAASGTISLTGAGGVAVNAALGNSTTGAITVSGALSGSGNIALGTGGLTVTQSSNSTYSGAISGAEPVTLAGGGSLTLSGTNTYTGATAVNAGSLVLTGSEVGTTTVTTSSASVYGTGTLAAGTINGAISPGTAAGTTGILSTTNLAFGSSANFTADLSSTTAGTGYDQISNTGTVNLGGATLTVNPLNSIAGYSAFTIITSTGAISGTFAGLNDGSTITASGQAFTINYTGNSVVLTRQGPPVITSTGNPTSQTANAGQSVTFTAAATGLPVPGVQWQVNTGTGGFTNISGATSTSLTVVANSAGALNGYQYQAVFTNTQGSTPTASATLTVDSITGSPSYDQIAPGGTASFTAASSNPSGTDTVQWQVNQNDGNGFTPLSDGVVDGATYSGSGTTTLTITNAPVDFNNYSYEAVFTNSNGNLTSQPATLNVQVLSFVSTPNINIANVGSLSASGFGTTDGDSISLVITDSASNTVAAGTTTVGSDGKWSVSGLDASTLVDGPVTYSITESGTTIGTVTQSETKGTVAPTVAFTSTPNVNVANVSSVPASGTGENGDSITVVITDSASHTTTAATTTVGSSGVWSVSINASSLNDGSVTYAVTETDADGNPVTATQAVTKIATAPTVAFTTAPNILAANTSNATASGTGTNGDTISVVITDSASHSSTTATTTVSGGTWTVAGINATGLSDGTVTYSVTETDAVGNTASTTQTASKDLANITETSGVVTYAAGPGINNNVSVTISGSYFVFSDPAEAMYTNISGATGSGTTTVDIPTTSVTGISLSLGDGADAITSSGVVLTTQNLSISHSGTGLTIGGPLTTTTGNISVSSAMLWPTMPI